MRKPFPYPALRTRPRLPPPVLLVPALVVAVAVLLPLVYLVLRAAEASGGWGYLLRPRTLRVLWNTVLLATSVTVAGLAIALPYAFLTLRTDLPGRRVWYVLGVLPLVIPTYVGSFVMVSAFATGGLVSSALGIRLPSVYGYWGALIVLTLFTYPYLLLTLRAGLRGLDPSLEEAARSLGRSPWATFWRVTLPHLRPAIAAGALLVALYVLSDFGAVSMLRFDSFTRAIYVQYANSFNRSNAAALGLMLVALTGTVLLADAWLRGRRRIDRVGSGVARKSVRVRLGLWTLPALCFVTLVVLLALVAPLSVIGVWLWRGIVAAQPVGVDWASLRNAVTVSVLAAFSATVAAIPVAVLAVRFRSRLSALLERLSYLGYALPGIVVALTLVFFGARYALWLYQTVALLVFGYSVLFLPQAVGNLRATLLQVNPHLEEAARSLGKGAGATLWQVTLPLIRPGLITSAALVFLTTMKELPVTLLLGPTGFSTLATRIWSWTAEAFYARAAPYALLLVLTSSVSVALLLSQERE